MKCLRGIFLTLDVVVAMLLLFLVVMLAFAYYSSSSQQASSFSTQLLRSYTQDAATVLAWKGYLSAPLDSLNNSNTSGIREVLAATPSSVCMQVEAHGAITGEKIGGATSLSDGLIGYWKLNEGTGYTAADYSGNGFTGVLHGEGTRFVEAGASGGAAYFDGRYGSSNEGYVEVAHDSRLEPSSITVALWVKFPGEDGTSSYPLIKWSGYAMKVSNGETPYWRITGYKDLYAISDWRRIPFNQWALLVGTFDNATKNASFYINGEYTSSTVYGDITGVSSILNDTIKYGETYPLTISTDSRWGANTMNGSTDEVRIYNRALTQAEIEELYSNPGNLLYVVGKPGCTYSGGEIQSLTVPFAHNSNQNENNYYYAVFRTWLKGERP